MAGVMCNWFLVRCDSQLEIKNSIRSKANSKEPSRFYLEELSAVNSDNYHTGVLSSGWSLLRFW